ncbi:hypothetical protein N8J89_08070 [Crossiella sp. CA-258035]|uniref:hypothetical protein n=1 Tax=Crossiella sp. CA-258035 TaxID=2981138 RepID=UPI0024BC4C75|nr:hypothetical protein [Crossiella sp. CA-258035]WHT21011.1 hypothetical protein N8J89_08070 [Crossiella sp. CA-258035]
MPINSGPPPNPNARRRNARTARERLPAEGRKGPAPDWPLPKNLTLMTQLQIAQSTVDDLKEQEPLEAADRRKLNKALEQLVFLDTKAQTVEQAELTLWLELWRTPQAVAWERLRWTREVAQYVRWKVLAEWGDIDAAKEARQLSDRLGLTPMSLLRLQWDIVSDEVAEKRQEVRSQSSSKARSRLKVVADDAVEGTGA